MDQFKDPENQKYFTLFGKCHVSTVTKAISFFYIAAFISVCTWAGNFESPEIALFTLLFLCIYLIPFIGINKFQPWALLPLLFLIAFDIFVAFSLICLTLTMLFHYNDSHLYPMLVIAPIYICFEAFYFYVTIRYFQYIKEMKLVQQKQNIDPEKVIYC
uniref:MARVEL domain-containing protein n=1 Tax=Panagrolaimus davidi TaxID=227884 RepID=A0A914QBG8_9BILA